MSWDILYELMKVLSIGIRQFCPFHQLGIVRVRIGDMGIRTTYPRHAQQAVQLLVTHSTLDSPLCQSPVHLQIERCKPPITLALATKIPCPSLVQRVVSSQDPCSVRIYIFLYPCVFIYLFLDFIYITGSITYILVSD